MGMEANIGSTDRIVRLVAGVVLAAVALAGFGNVVELGATVGVVLLVAGAILVGTSLTRMCPIYRVLGVDTCRTGSR